MAQTPSTAGLFTTVKNTSGGSRLFGFLRKGGMRLAANETVTIPGNVVSTLGGQTSQRRFKALEAALRSEALAIVSTPAVYLYDAHHGRTRQLAISNELLGVVDPGWEASGSSDFVQE